MSEYDKKLLWAEVDLGSLRHNLKALRAELAGPSVQILAVVKADAYGHGMKKIAGALKEEGVRFFGVANVEEALDLRRVCPSGKILVLGSFHRKQAPLFIHKGVIPTVSSVEDVEVLEKALKGTPGTLAVHLKVDTGMGRLGVWHRSAESLLRRVFQSKRLQAEGLYTHFAHADEEEIFGLTRKQIALFEEVVRKARRLGLKPRYCHAANSLGLLRFKDSHFNLVRPGIALYGIHPLEERKKQTLRPLLRWKARIAFLKKMEKGRTVSYGATHRTSRETLIAVLPVGYSHGYRISFSNKAWVLVHGKRCPVVGRVTMDQTLVDVGAVPQVRRWDEATLIGKDGNDEILAEDLARIAGTIPYEILCSIHSRVPRIYRE